MRNKLHQIVRLKLDSNKDKPVLETKPCGCNANQDHPENYTDYLKRARKIGATWSGSNGS